MFYILKSAYLYRSRGFFFLINIFLFGYNPFCTDREWKGFSLTSLGENPLLEEALQVLIIPLKYIHKTIDIISADILKKFV